MRRPCPLSVSVPLATSTALAFVASLGGCDDDHRGAVCAGLQQGDLVISEVMANPSGVDDDREWVEVHNPGSHERPLTGLELVYSTVDGSDARGSRLSTAEALPAGAYAVLGGMSDEARPSYVTHAYGDALGSLGNASGRLTLRCGDQVIDDVVYPETTDGSSRGFDGDLPPDVLTNDDPERWCESRTAFVTGDRGSPGARNDVCAQPATGRCQENGLERDAVAPGEGDLVVTEVHPNPSVVPDNAGEWVEVLALADVDLNGLELGRVEGTVAVTLASSHCLRVSSGTYVVIASNNDALNNGGVTNVDFVADLALSNSAGGLFVGHSGTVIDALQYVSPEEGTAIALDPRHLTPEANDDEALWCPATNTYGDGDRGTPGSANMPCRFPVPEGMCEDHDGTLRPMVPPAVGDLVVTEVMADPAAVTDAVGEWFEVYVAADVDLNGLEIGTAPDRSIALWTDSSCRHVSGGTHLLFARSALSGSNGGLPANAIPFDFGLANDPGSLFIGVNGIMQDEVAWSSSPTGASLQLEAADVDPALNDALAEVACAGTVVYGQGDRGSPGTSNLDCLDEGECWEGANTRAAVTPLLGDLYINEIMPNPNTAEPGSEWLEVAVTADVDLNHVFVASGASRFTFGGVDCIPVRRGELLVFARSAQSTSNGDLPRVDFVYASISLTNSSGSLELRTSNALLDVVTWNTSLNGRSRALIAGLAAPALDNDDPVHWCHPTVAYGAGANGNFGTPGEANTCP